MAEIQQPSIKIERYVYLHVSSRWIWHSIFPSSDQKINKEFPNWYNSLLFLVQRKLAYLITCTLAVNKNGRPGIVGQGIVAGFNVLNSLIINKQKLASLIIFHWVLHTGCKQKWATRDRFFGASNRFRYFELFNHVIKQLLIMSQSLRWYGYPKSIVFISLSGRGEYCTSLVAKFSIDLIKVNICYLIWKQKKSNK